MNYVAIIQYKNKSVDFKVKKIQLSEICELTTYLKKVRNANNDSIEALSEKTGYKAEDIEQMENGEKVIDKKYLIEFANAYQIPKKLSKLGIEPNQEKIIQLADRLYELRTEKGFTQADMAQMIKVARTTYASYERGENEPDINTLIEIANIYKVSLDYLVNREY